MAFKIADGEGVNGLAGVTSEGQLKVESENNHQQHFQSKNYGRVFQLNTTMTFSSSGTHNVLFLQNTSNSLNLFFTYIRVQTIVNSVTLPSSGTYFQTGLGKTYSSGGDALTPTNVNGQSGFVAPCNAYGNNPTLGGSLNELDLWSPSSNGEEMKYAKEGSIMLGLNNTFTIRFTTTDSSGWCKARATFFFKE